MGKAEEGNRLVANRDPSLEWLEQLKKKAAALHQEEAQVIKQIREGFVDKAIVFMDVVGSTAFKVTMKDEPERWILRVRQFCQLLAAAVQSCNGRVVKFLGDEVMAVFDDPLDAQNLVGRIAQIEENLKSATGVETRIKVAADFGPVYLLNFDGHNESDPQGTPVDRCARIGKFGMPGEVLASQAFTEKTSSLRWVKVGMTELKGLGKQAIYQLSKKTVTIAPRKEVMQSEYDNLIEERDELRIKTGRLQAQNKQLQQQIDEAGGVADPDAVADSDDEDSAWEPVEKSITELRLLIEKAPGSTVRYARFVFLHCAGLGGDEYNKFENKIFDELIESKIVCSYHDNSTYEINEDHLLNKRVIDAVTKVDKVLSKYLKAHSQSPDDLFEWKMSSPEFWRDCINYAVVA